MSEVIQIYILLLLLGGMVFFQLLLRQLFFVFGYKDIWRCPEAVIS